MPPGEPGVRRQNVGAQLGQALGQVSRVLSLERGQECVDPCEGDESHAALKRARPVPAGVRRIVGHPVLEPVETVLAAAPVAEQPAGLGQAHRAIPAAWLPERLDCRAAGQFAVVELERGQAGGDIDSGEVVALPVRRRVCLYVEMAEEAEATGGDALGVTLQRLAERLGSGGGFGEFGEG